MAKRNRRRFTAEQKADLLKSHLKDKVPVSELCEKNALQPSQFYGWLNQAMEKLPAALVDQHERARSSSRERELAEENAKLKAKLAKKDEVIAEVTEELVKAKKKSGEL